MRRSSVSSRSLLRGSERLVCCALVVRPSGILRCILRPRGPPEWDPFRELCSGVLTWPIMQAGQAEPAPCDRGYCTRAHPRSPRRPVGERCSRRPERVALVAGLIARTVSTGARRGLRWGVGAELVRPLGAWLGRSVRRRGGAGHLSLTHSVYPFPLYIIIIIIIECFECVQCPGWCRC